MNTRSFSTHQCCYLLLIAICLSALALTPALLSAEELTCEYDTLNRLTKVTYGNGIVISYEYDAAGNRLQKSVSKKRKGDFDGDADVDGSDLAVSAAHFGRTDCGHDCKGDFDGDGDVDDSDLAVFAANFGKTDCP